MANQTGLCPSAKALGFRVEPQKVHWAAVDGSTDQPVLIDADTMPAPKAFGEPQALSWYRNEVIAIIERYRSNLAGIRDTEAAGPRRGVQSLQQRCRIEGVIIEVANARGLTIVSGRLATISANLGSRAAKKYLDTDEFRGIDWSSKSSGIREAIMVAVSTLESA